MPGAAAAQTISDPQLPLDELEIRLKPLTPCELAEEVLEALEAVQEKMEDSPEASQAESTVSDQVDRTETDAALSEAQKQIDEAFQNT